MLSAAREYTTTRQTRRRVPPDGPVDADGPDNNSTLPGRVAPALRGRIDRRPRARGGRVIEDVAFATIEKAVFDVLEGGDALADKAMKLEPTAVYHNEDAWALGGTSLREAARPIITSAEDGDTDAWERARVEKGRPRCGFEFNSPGDSKLLESCGPLEAAVRRRCAEGKCYLGAGARRATSGRRRPRGTGCAVYVFPRR